MRYLRFVQIVFVSILVLACFLGGCSKSENPTESQLDKALIGDWKLTEMNSESGGVVETLTESLIDSIGLVWTLKLEEDGTAIQITNMSGTLETMPGTWKTSSNQLSLTLNSPGGGLGTLVYDYAQEATKLYLKWEISAGTKFSAIFTEQ